MESHSHPMSTGEYPSTNTTVNSHEREIERNRAFRADWQNKYMANLRKSRSYLHQCIKWVYLPFDAVFNQFRNLTYARKRMRRISEYLKEEGFKGLNVGCGKHPNVGWLNTDLLPSRRPWNPLGEIERKFDFPLDITGPLPFKDQCLHAIFGEEVIEHIDRLYVPGFFKEAFRVLTNDGVLRLTTPDLQKICSVYLGYTEGVTSSSFEPYWRSGDWSDDIWINAAFTYYGHRHVWSFDALKDTLHDAGFTRIERMQAFQTSSQYKELENLEKHGVTRPETLKLANETRIFIEAFK